MSRKENNILLNTPSLIYEIKSQNLSILMGYTIFLRMNLFSHLLFKCDLWTQKAYLYAFLKWIYSAYYGRL